MRILMLFLMLSMSALADDVSINPLGTFRVQVDGELTEGTYTLYNDAVSAAINAAFECPDCVVYVVSPLFVVEASGPPPVDVDPDKIDAYYSVQRGDEGLIDPKPLDGAVLPSNDVYVQWYGPGLESANSWCCKPPGGEHNSADISKTGDLTFVLHLERHTGATTPLEFYSDLIINGNRVQDNYRFFALDPSVVIPHPVTLKWTAPTKREDGSNLPGSEISGYLIEATHDGDVSGFETTSTSYVIDTLPGVWLFRLVTIDTSQRYSKPSKSIAVEVE